MVLGKASDVTASGFCQVCACVCGLKTLLLSKLASYCEACLLDILWTTLAGGAVFARMRLLIAEPQLGQNADWFTRGAPQRGQVGARVAWPFAGAAEVPDWFAVALAASIAS